MGSTVRDDVIEALVTVCGVDAEQLVDTADLETLSIDSLDLIEVAMIIEEVHDVEIESEAFAEVETFGGAVSAFQRIVATRHEA